VIEKAIPVHMQGEKGAVKGQVQLVDGADCCMLGIVVLVMKA
jgi:hypothetical protein